MGNPPPTPPRPPLGRELGARSERHLEATFPRLLRHPSALVEPDVFRVVSGAPHPFGNLLGGPAARDPRRFADAVAPLIACGAPSAILYLGAAAPTEVAAPLAAQGFGLAEVMPAMAVRIDDLAATRLPHGYTLERVGGDEAAREWTAAFGVGYELPHQVAEIFAPVSPSDASDAAIQYFSVRYEDEVVATSMLHLHDGLAGVYCVATAPAHRGRGLGAHATAAPLRMVRGLGFEVGILQASPAGHPVYLRLGFQDLGAASVYVRMPGA